jgi:hypothetical protein
MQQIDEILALTDQVRQYIDDGRWAEAVSLENERMVMLNQLFARDDIAAIGPECEQLARDLLARNARMTEAVQAGRRSLQETTRSVNASAVAVSAYRRNEPAHHW